MMLNFDKGLRKLELVVNDWRHKFLKIFGKLTVVKTFMLSVISHVTTVLPTPSKEYCKKFEKLMIDFIKGEWKLAETDNTVKLEASIIFQCVLFTPKANNRLGLQRVSSLWSAIQLGWLRRLGHDSFWKTLHVEDLNLFFLTLTNQMNY